MRIVLESDAGEELDAVEMEKEDVHMLHRDIRMMAEDSPDYPAAWSDRNLSNFVSLFEMLSREETREAYFDALSRDDDGGDDDAE